MKETKLLPPKCPLFGGSTSLYLLSLSLAQDVKYTMKLDMYEFCTTDLQHKLNPMRTKFKELEERKIVRFFDLRRGKI